MAKARALQVFVKRLLPLLKKVGLPGEPAALGIACLAASGSEHRQKISWAAMEKSPYIVKDLTECFRDLGLGYPGTETVEARVDDAAVAKVVRAFWGAPADDPAWYRGVLAGLAAAPGGAPPAVADLMVRLAEPKGRVFVPFCCSGGLLAALTAAPGISLTWSAEGDDPDFCALVLRAAATLSSFKVEGPVLIDKAQGPFSFICADVLPKGAGKKLLTSKVLERLLSLLDSDGVFLALVSPDVVSGRSFAGLRRDLVEKGHLDAVMRVPKEQFTNVRAGGYILIVRPDRQKEKPVLFADLGGIEEVTDKKMGPELSAVVAAYRDFVEWEINEEQPYLHLASRDEMNSKGHDLDILLYVTPPEEKIDLREEYDRLYRLERERKELEERMDGLLAEMSGRW